MIGTIRKHSTWLWAIVITVIVITFVFWGVQSPSNPGGVGGHFGFVHGEKITEGAYINAKREVYLRFFLNNGDWPGPEAEQLGFDENRETYYRLLMIYNLESAGIRAGREAKGKAASQILQSFQRQGINSLQALEKALLAPKGFVLADLDRFIEHEIGIRQLVAVEGMAGQLVTPQQAESLFKRENQEVSTQVVFFSASNHLQQVQVDSDEVARFFTNTMAHYRIPERVQVTYVTFSITNFLEEADQELAGITNLEQVIEAVYQQRGTNWYSDESPEEAKDLIREEQRRDLARLSARRRASEFTSVVMEMEPAQASNLEMHARAEGYPVNVTEPFDLENWPADLGVNSDFAVRAFRLTDEEPFALPVVTEDAVYAMALHSRIPSEIPPLEQVIDQVTERYRFRQAILLAQEAGAAFAEAVTNGLNNGEAFTAISTAKEVNPVFPGPLSLATRSMPEVEEHTLLSQFKQVVFTIPVGSASDFIYTTDGGYVVYVESELEFDVARMESEMPQYLSFLRRALQTEAFNQWFRREVESGLRNTPIFQPPPAELAPSEG